MRHLADFYGVSLDELKEIAPTDPDRKKASNTFDRGDAQRCALSEYIEFFNDPDSRQKYRLLSRSEKDLVFYFNQIPDNYKWELVEIAKVLARKPK